MPLEARFDGVCRRRRARGCIRSSSSEAARRRFASPREERTAAARAAAAQGGSRGVGGARDAEPPHKPRRELGELKWESSRI